MSRHQVTLGPQGSAAYPRLTVVFFRLQPLSDALCLNSSSSPCAAGGLRTCAVVAFHLFWQIKPMGLTEKSAVSVWSRHDLVKPDPWYCYSPCTVFSAQYSVLFKQQQAFIIHADGSHVVRVFIGVCVFVCRFFHAISQKPMQP